MSHGAKSCNAECSLGSCSSSQLFPASCGEEVADWGSCPAGPGSRNQELGGGGDVLPEALMVLPSAPHSQARFHAEINNEDKPFPSPIFSGSRVVESIPKASRKFLRVVGGFTHLLSD